MFQISTAALRDGSRPLGLLVIAASLSSFLTAGCNERPTVSGETICCSDEARRILLKSKVDDDDGDGIILDEDFPDINDEDDDIADHSWIRDDAGVYHLFFQNEGLFSPIQIEHYTTTDLRSLDYVGIALSPNPGAWDANALWAPHVVRSGDMYFMFYTGVSGSGADAKQRIGLATSTDLMTWTRHPINSCPGTTGDGCIYECIESWTTAGGPPGSHNQQCRDPFIIWDSDSQRWVMFATAKSTNQFGVVTVAHSTDLINWSGAGYINPTRRLASGIGAQTTGGMAENPFVMTHEGTHYLLFSDWQDPEDTVSVEVPRTMTQYATSSTLAADSSGSLNWTYRGYTPDPAVNAIEVQVINGDIWVMSQSISNILSGEFPNRRQLRLKCVIFDGDFSFDTQNLKIPQGSVLRGVNPMAPDFLDERRN